MNNANGRKLRHGTVWFLITAAVIAAVILLNAGFSALCSSRLLYEDMTPDSLYTLQDETVFMLEKTFREVNEKRKAEGQENAKVDIIFCSDPDLLKRADQMRYVYYTALNLQKRFPDTVRVSTVDVWSNPSVVDPYRTNSYSSIYQTNVIIASGSEYRISTLRSYFTYNSTTDETPWAYNGEKRMVSSIIAVTKAEAPICGITVNHGEPFGEGYRDADGNEKYSNLLAAVESAGYEICFLDLEHDEIPVNCRLILTFDPQTDFTSGDYLGGTDMTELAKLDNFIDSTYSFMAFVDADTPSLPNLEEFLEDWGVSFARYRNPSDVTEVLGNYRVVSPQASLDNAGISVLANYETEGLGGSITEDMRKAGAAPKVVFSNAMPLRYSASYEQTYQLADADAGIGAFTYGTYFRNNHSRSVFDVFRADANGTYAVAQKDGTVLQESGSDVTNADGHYKLMTMTRESRSIGEGRGYTNINDASYVCVFGSTDFADNALLTTGAYGNLDVLLSVLRSMGREIDPVGLGFKTFYSAEIKQTTSAGTQSYTQAGNTAWTVALALIPALACAGAGTVILVRRKLGH